MRTFWPLLVALVLQTLLRLVLADRLGLAADEAYYWCWSQAPALGYFDHPPMVAWGIGLGTALLGDTELGVRAVGVLAQAGAYGLLLWHERRSLLALFLLGAPMLALGGTLATPDALLCAAWALGIFAAERRVFWLLGLACGVAMLCKLTGWLLWPALWLAGDKRQRGLYGALGLALLLVSPNLYWNATQDWVSWRFQLNHGLASEEGGGIAGFLKFWLGQAALVGPFAVAAAWAWLAGGWRDRAPFWTAALPFAAASVAAFRGPAELNWAMPAWIAVGLGLSRAEGFRLRLGTLGGTFAAMLGAVAALHAYTPVMRFTHDPLDALVGGELLGQSAEAWGRAPVLTSRYQEAAWIRFYGHIDATTVPGVGREDQFDRWPRTLPERALFVRPARASERLATDGLYAERGETNVVVARDGERVVQAWQLIPVEGLLP